MTKQLDYLIPLLLSVLVSCAISRFINESIYDTIAIAKKLPYFPHLHFDKSILMTASDVMETNLVFITR